MNRILHSVIVAGIALALSVPVAQAREAGWGPTHKNRQQMREKKREVYGLKSAQKEEKEALKDEAKAAVRKLRQENTAEIKALKAGLDADKDGVLSDEEILAGQDKIKALREQNRTEKKALKKSTRKDRQTLQQAQQKEREALQEKYRTEHKAMQEGLWLNGTAPVQQ